MAQNILLLLAGAIVIWTLSKVVAILKSPLYKIPNAHLSAPFSRLWLVWIRSRGKEITTCYDAHKSLGPVIRIGPNEISINCLEQGVQTVYSASWDKAPVFGNFLNYGHNPLFAIIEGKAHAERKRIYSGIYSKSTIDKSVELQDILRSKGQILRTRIEKWIADRKIVNVFPISEAYNMDAITSYLYGSGNGTKWLENDEEAAPLLEAFQVVLEPWAYFAFTEIEKLVLLAGKIGIKLIPTRVFLALEMVHPYSYNLMKQALNDFDQREALHKSVPQALKHLKTKMAESKIPEKDQVDVLASDLLDQIHAAHEASGIVLTFVMWYLSKHPLVQSKLRTELQALVEAQESLLQSHLLEDILLETIRLHPAALGPFPRAAPDDAKVGGYELPTGTLVSASPYWLGRNAAIFPEPDAWDPSRWTTASVERRKSMKRWVWMFTSGSRMCLGEHLAMKSMKSFIADVYVCSKTTVAKESSMKQLESFISPPEDSNLLLRFEKA